MGLRILIGLAFAFCVKSCVVCGWLLLKLLLWSIYFFDYLVAFGSLLALLSFVVLFC